MSAGPAQFETEISREELRIRARGDWRIMALSSVDDALRAAQVQLGERHLILEMAEVTALDTAGAMALQRVAAKGDGAVRIEIRGAKPAHARLLEQVQTHICPPEAEITENNILLVLANRLGKGLVDAYYSSIELLSFIGLTVATGWRVIARPSRFRMTSTVHHMEESGLNAVPIVLLMSFLIGAVVAFMGATILQQFNAAIFTVELVGISVFREFGVLLSAILLAGRSGSAFTAQIGSMKIREEIDAMQSLGLDPVEVLVLPRVIALLIMLPVLAFLAALMGIIGGALVAWGTMDISLALFKERTQDAIHINHFWAGLIKAPFFAFVIAVIGCFQGMKVEGSAESLGQRTTLSVVQALFLVIVLDAFFAMFFLEIDF